MAAIWYWHPYLHRVATRLVHGRHYTARLRRVAALIGKDNSVLDLGCGTCALARFLDRSTEYEGWDLNEGFIRFNKRRGLKVKVKDCFEYCGSPDVDVIVLSDLLHHVSLVRRERLLALALRFARKKVIVVEPFHAPHHPYWWAVALRRRLGLEPLLGDYDGINKEKESYRILTKQHLLTLFTEHHPITVLEEGKALLAVFAPR